MSAPGSDITAGQPEISLIVPTHDRRPLLQRKLRALERETLPFEVIVVADACSDDTEAFLQGFSPHYPLRWVTTAGAGAASARNRGAALARGALLLFSDDDVIGRPGWLEANVAAHRRPGVVAAGRLVLAPHLSHGATRSGPASWWNAGSPSLSLRAELFREVGGYDASFSDYGGEDPDLGYRLLRAGARFVSLEGAVCEHWDEEYLATIEAKAAAAGRAHVRVWRKHGDARIALALGVHPAVAAIKRLLLNDFLGRFLHSPRYRYERAYLDGALAAMRAPDAGAAA